MNKPFVVLLITCRSDIKQALELKKRLLHFKAPKKLVGKESQDGIVPAFIDQVIINLDQKLDENSTTLDAKYAVVLCSNEAVKSADVDTWLRAFKQRHTESKVLCYILKDEPNATDNPNLGLLEAFPDGVRFKVDANGELTKERTEPIAADSRNEGDGKKNAQLKLLSGIFSVRYEALKQRYKVRNMQRIFLIFSIFLTITAYSLTLYWQKQKEEQQRFQAEFDSLVDKTFSSANNKLTQTNSLVKGLRKLEDNIVHSQHKMDAIQYRLSHTRLTPTVLAQNKDLDLLISTSDKKHIYGINLKDKLLTLTESTGKKLYFNLNSFQWNTYITENNVSYITGIELLDNKTGWLIIRQNDSWHVVKLDLKEQTAQTFSKQKYKRYFSNIFLHGNERLSFNKDLYYKAYRTYPNIKDGQVLVHNNNKIGVYDAESNQTYFTDLPDNFKWNNDKLEDGVNLEWHRGTQTLLLMNKDKGVWIWHYTKNSLFNKAIHNDSYENAGVINDWLYINKTTSDSKYSSKLYNLTNNRKLIIPSAHSISIHKENDRIKVLTKSNIFMKSETHFNAISSDLIFERDINWKLSLGNNSNNRYYINNGQLFRQSKDYGAELKHWSVDCSNDYLVSDSGDVHCIVKGKWLMYRPDTVSKQQAITLDGYIRHYYQSSNGNIWAITNTSSGQLQLLRSNGKQLIIVDQILSEDECFHYIKPVNDEFIYIMASSPGAALFNDLPCRSKQPYMTIAANLKSETQLILTNNVLNSSIIASRKGFLPNYDIDGVYHDLINLHWYTTTDNIRHIHPILKKFKVTNTFQPFHLSQNPITGDVAMTAFLFDETSKKWKLNLTINDASGQHIKQEIISHELKGNNFTKFWLHGFSTDGKLFWWGITSTGEKTQVNWLNLKQKKTSSLVVSNSLPRSQTPFMDYILFSSSGRYLIHGEPFTSGQYRVYDLKDNKLVYEKTIRKSFVQNMTKIDFHKTKPWMIFDGEIIDLSGITPLKKINYPGRITLLDFHPLKDWATGRCDDKNICIVDLSLGQVIFHLELPKPIVKPIKYPEQIRFTQDGKSLSYILAGRTLVFHELGELP